MRIARLVLLPLALSAACLKTFGYVPLTTSMQRWVGQDEAALVSKWGAPDRSATLANGAKVVTWLTTYNGAGMDEAPQMVQCKRSFTVSGTGKVEAWSSDGCPKYIPQNRAP